MTISNVIKWGLFRRLLSNEYHNIYNHVMKIGDSENEELPLMIAYENYIQLSSYTQEVDFIETERQHFFEYLDCNYDSSKNFNDNIDLYTSYTVKDITNE